MHIRRHQQVKAEVRKRTREHMVLRHDSARKIQRRYRFVCRRRDPVLIETRKRLTVLGFEHGAMASLVPPPTLGEVSEEDEEEQEQAVPTLVGAEAVPPPSGQ